MAVSPVLPTGRYHCGRPAALRDFSPVYDRSGSSATEAVDTTLRCMSALPPKADKQQRCRHVRFVPLADERTAAKRNRHSVSSSRLTTTDEGRGGCPLLPCRCGSASVLL